MTFMTIERRSHCSRAVLPAGTFVGRLGALIRWVVGGGAGDVWVVVHLNTGVDLRPGRGQIKGVAVVQLLSAVAQMPDGSGVEAAEFGQESFLEQVCVLVLLAVAVAGRVHGYHGTVLHCTLSDSF